MEISFQADAILSKLPIMDHQEEDSPTLLITADTVCSNFFLLFLCMTFMLIGLNDILVARVDVSARIKEMSSMLYWRFCFQAFEKMEGEPHLTTSLM